MSAWEKPRLWIESLEDGDLRVVSETESLLSQITQQVVVIAVAGLYRTGKSYIMNRLAGVNAGFALGPTVQAETKGIWVWCLTHPSKKNHVMVLIDTEGLSDPEKADEKNDISIFSLAVLLSSTFIFNILGKLDQKMINDLYLITQLTERIKVKSSQKDDEDADLTAFTEFLPAFVVAVRDFTLELQLNNRPVSANEYFNHILELKAGSGRKTFDYNQPREAIRNSFRSHFCFTFTRPVQDEKLFSLLALNQISDADLAPDFIRQSDNFCHYIYSTSTVKTLKRGQPVNGRVLSTLAIEYVKAINSGAVPCIESTVTLVAQRENERVIAESVQLYKKAMANTEMPVESAEIDEAHKKASKEATDYFNVHVIFDDKNEFLEKFVSDITDMFDQALHRNAEVSEEKCVSILNCLHANIIGGKMQNQAYAQPGGYDEYCIDFTRLLDGYEASLQKGVKAKEVLHDFMKDKDTERNLIMQADNKLTEQQKENEKIVNEKKMLEIEKKAADEACKELECHHEMLKKDNEEQMRKVREEFERQQTEKEIELQNLMQKRLEEQERLIKEGFEEKAQELNSEIENLKSQKTSNIVGQVFEGIERIAGLAPQLFMYRKMFKSAKPKGFLRT